MAPPNENPESQPAFPSFSSYADIFPSEKDEPSTGYIKQAQQVKSDEGETPDVEEIQTKRKQQFKDAQSGAMELSTILQGEGYGNEVSDIIREGKVGLRHTDDGFWSGLGQSLKQGATVALRNLQRVGRATGAVIASGIRDELSSDDPETSILTEEGSKKFWEPVDWKKNAEGALASLGEKFDYVKKGFSLEDRPTPYGPMDVGSGRDMWNAVLGDDNQKAIDDYFASIKGPFSSVDKKDYEKYNWPERMLGNLLGGPVHLKIPGSPLLDMSDDPDEPLLARLADAPGGMANTAIESAKLVPSVAYLGTEILTDPITFVGFKPITEAIKGTTGLVYKGSMMGLAKISTKAAEAVESGANKLTERITDIAGVIDRKYGVINEYTKVLGDSGDAKNIVENVQESIVAAKSNAQEVAKDFNKMIGGTQKMGRIRTYITKPITESISNLIGYKPSNAVMKYLVGSDDATSAMKTIGDALIQAGDRSSEILPTQFADTAKDTIKTLLSDVADPKEWERISTHLDNVISKKMVTEYSPLYKYAVDLKDLFTSMKTGKYKFATAQGEIKYGNVFTDIAKDRMGARLEEMKVRFKTLDETYSAAKVEGLKVADQAQKDIRQVKVDALKNYNGKLADSKNAFMQEYNGVADGLKRDAMEQIKTLKSEPFKGSKDLLDEMASQDKLGLESRDPSITQKAFERRKVLEQRLRLEKAKDVTKREKAIFEVRRELVRQTNKLNKYRDSHFEELSNTLKTEMADEIAKNTGQINKNLAYRISELIAGVPDKNVLKVYKQKAVSDIRGMYEKEKDLFGAQAAKAKFMDIHNDMIERYQQVHERIFDKAISDLPDAWKGFAKRWRSTMDFLGMEEQARGRTDTLIPNYFSRMIKQRPEGGLLKDDPAQLLSDYFNSKGTGMSRFAQERKLQDFQSFNNWIQKHGGKVAENPLDIIFDRYMRSKADQSFNYILENFPHELRTGKAGQKMKQYLDYVWKGGIKSNNPISRGWDTLKGTYQLYTKALLTVMSPAYYVKDTMGYPFLVGQASSWKHSMDVGSMVDAVALKTGLQDGIRNKAGEFLSAHELESAMLNHGLIGSSFTRGSIPETVDHFLNRYSKADPRHWILKGLHAGQVKEDLGRSYAAITFWKDGMPLKDAIRKAKVAMYDFNDFNYIDRAMAGAFTFYGFNRKNMVGTLKTLYENPSYHATMSRLIDAINYGQTPSREDLTLLADQNPYGEGMFRIWKDLSLGKYESIKMGFTPLENVWENAGDLAAGDWKGFMRHATGLFTGAQKIEMQNFYEAMQPPWTQKQKYNFLPKEYSALPEPAITAMNKVSQTLGWGTVQRKDRIVYEMGEPHHETGVFVPPQMMTLVMNLPTSRLQSEALKLVRAANPQDPAQTSLEQTLGQYLTGYRREIFDFPMKREQKKMRNYKALKDLADRVGVSFSDPKINIKKEFRIKYKEQINDNKENLQDQ